VGVPKAPVIRRSPIIAYPIGGRRGRGGSVVVVSAFIASIRGVPAVPAGWASRVRLRRGGADGTTLRMVLTEVQLQQRPVFKAQPAE
jgi:hypothetical protein